MTANRWAIACLTLAAAALAACGGDDATAPPPPPPTANVTGIWDFTEILVDQSFGLTCNDTGSYVFAQTGSAFSGTSGQVGTCTQGGESFSNDSDEDAVTSGSVSETDLTFNVGGCLYRGAVTGDPPNQITGTVTCGQTTTGTWQAVVGAPVATVALAPPASSVLVGGRVQLVAIARSGTGRRLFGRAATWASDNQAAAIVAAGLVTGQAPGTANITAAVQSLTASLAITVRVVTFSSLSAGLIHACGRVADGSVYCWGDHSVGQLGSATAPDTCNGFPCTSTAQSVIGGPPVPPGFAALTVGGGHACGLDPGGAAFCWGWNVSGQLGTAATTETCFGDPCARQPVAVSGGLAFARLSGGFAHSCGLTAGAAAHCWGENSNGQLGNGSTASSAVPVAVGGGLFFDSLSAGAYHTCAVTSAGAAYCWGYNEAGQVGDNSTVDRPAPSAVIGNLTFATVSAGRFHSCGVTTAGAAYCWGLNVSGQLGATSTSTCSGAPCGLTALAVGGGLTFTALSAGGSHTCGLATGGAAYCWGANAEGELGNGTQIASPSPVAVSGSLVFTQLTTGLSHSCGLTGGGVAYCWGLNQFGQLGNGTATRSVTPSKVLGQP
ncbi:MAG: Ig-like domain-containing protein [Gemmatimonadales bacterium]